MAPSNPSALPSIHSKKNLASPRRHPAVTVAPVPPSKSIFFCQQVLFPFDTHLTNGNRLFLSHLSIFSLCLHQRNESHQRSISFGLITFNQWPAVMEITMLKKFQRKEPNQKQKRRLSLSEFVHNSNDNI